MKILIVAYANHPYYGSEPGIGWEAVTRAAKKHDVFVLTDSHNCDGWDRAAIEGIIPENVKVRFLRKNKPYCENRLIARFQSWIRYRDFNRLVLAEARIWHEEEHFDLCHQVNIASWRMPSPMWRLPVPFIWGPLGGAGWIPHKFRSMLSPSARLFEIARDINTALTSRSRSFRDAMRESTLVIAANEETERFLRPYRCSLPMVTLPVASLGSIRIESIRHAQECRTPNQPLQLFAGGNIEGRKGLDLALRALARAAATGMRFQYTIAGGGPETRALSRLAMSLAIDDMVLMHPGYSGNAYTEVLRKSDIYLLPSFRETMGITMVEAMIAGCYAIVADTSAQGEIVRRAGGTAVDIANQEAVIQGLADAIIWCDKNRETMRTIARQAGDNVKTLFDSDRHDRAVLDLYDRIAVSSNPT